MAPSFRLTALALAAVLAVAAPAMADPPASPPGHSCDPGHSSHCPPSGGASSTNSTGGSGSGSSGSGTGSGNATAPSNSTASPSSAPASSPSPQPSHQGRIQSTIQWVTGRGPSSGSCAIVSFTGNQGIDPTSVNPLLGQVLIDPRCAEAYAPSVVFGHPA